MTWKKGECGNPGGRPPKTKNMATVLAAKPHVADLDQIDNLLQHYFEGTADAPHTLEGDFHSEDLSPRDRLLIAERFMHYRFPTQQSTSMDVAVTEADASLTARIAQLADEDHDPRPRRP